MKVFLVAESCGDWNEDAFAVCAFSNESEASEFAKKIYHSAVQEFIVDPTPEEKAALLQAKYDNYIKYLHFLRGSITP